MRKLLVGLVVLATAVCAASFAGAAHAEGARNVFAGADQAKASDYDVLAPLAAVSG